MGKKGSVLWYSEDIRILGVGRKDRDHVGLCRYNKECGYSNCNGRHKLALNKELTLHDLHFKKTPPPQKKSMEKRSLIVRKFAMINYVPLYQ